ncbi:hypothetical protein BJ878DRAFT_481067 [Calycina marina]|uniref:Uncharacterized protein n=1 Tax=Calycina marina TaxID=1763456 RepID=A0A9P7Z0T1_9HELO|nr:hypothetical protein BJ878DRAFT_481067 [Calycina marina]
MIRLPASVISLGPRDLQDYEARRRERHKTKITIPAQDFERASKSSRTFALLALLQVTNTQGSEKEHASKRKARRQEVSETPTRKEHEDLQKSVSLAHNGDATEEGEDSFGELSPVVCNQIAETPENPALDARDTSPSKEDFHFGGFIESPSPRFTDSNSQSSSPFTDNFRQGLILPPEHRGRLLPRSPLIHSYNASPSPELRNTTSLTPQVMSRVTTDNSPGVLFAYPARRPRNFRHQTNSFSLESDEHIDVDDTQHQELDGTLLRPASASRLPAPFSGTSRSSSRVDSLPTYHSLPQLPSDTPFASPAGPLSSPFQETAASNNTPRMSPSRVIQRATRAARMITALMTESRALDDSTFSARPFIPSRQSRMPQLFIQGDFRTPQPSRFTSDDMPHTPRSYRVYNDRLPAFMQPQTPEQLPEARHRSRYHPSYTAPVRSVRQRLRSWSIPFTDGASEPYASPEPRILFHASTTPTRRGGRYGIDSGLTSEGFEGLYGGLENSSGV